MTAQFSPPLRFLLLLALFVPAPARPAGDEAERLVITATRMPTPLQRLGGSVTVMTADDIARHQYRDLSAALRSVPGLHVAPSGGHGAQTSVFVRGAESDHVLVLVDGIKATDPSSGLFAFADSGLANVERIEIVRGAHSAQYGSEAIGGIIHIITKRGEGEPSLRARAGAGSFDTENAALEASGASGALDWSANVSHFATDGESFTPRRLRNGDSDSDGYRRSAAGLKAGWQFAETTRLSLSWNYADFAGDYDADAGEDPGLMRSGHNRTASLFLDGDYFGGFWQPRWSAAYFSRQQTNRDHAVRTSESQGRRLQVGWRNVFVFSPRFRLLAGAETERETMRAGGDFSDGARSRAVHVQSDWTPLDGVSLGAGWRNEDADDFSSERSYNLSAAFTPRAGLRLRAAYGTGFKAPSLSDRFRDFPTFAFFGNPDLKPETSRSWEAGLDWQAGGWALGAVYFNTRIRDLISLAPSGRTLTNLRHASIEGLESYIRWQPVAAHDLRFDYTLTSAKDSGHQRLLRRPLRQAGLDWSWRPWPDASLNLRWNYTGVRADLSRVNFARVREGGYSTLDLALRRRLRDDVDLLVRADNLLDKRYEPVTGYLAAGVQWFVGLSLGLPGG